jgi:hypothetical protein
LKKGFRQDERDHHVFMFYTADGGPTEIKTRTSHGAKMKSIGNPLLGQMARQCCLDKQQFLNLVDCPRTREEYEAFLFEAKQIQAS